MSSVEVVLAKLPDHNKSGCGWSARCPAHEDRHASLSIAKGEDGRALVKCHAGCTTDAICSALGMSLADLFEPRPPSTSTDSPKSPANGQYSGQQAPEPKGKTFATAEEGVAELERQRGRCAQCWTYHDAHGEPVSVVVRWDLPDGKLIRPVSRYADGWRIAGMSEPRPLYSLPDLRGEDRIYVCEGEKSAEAARSIGLVATTSSFGAESAGKTDWTPLAGTQVAILPDNDAAGRKYADSLLAILATIQPPPLVKVVELPNLREAGDIVNWIEDHGDAAEPSELRQQIEALVDAAEVIDLSKLKRAVPRDQAGETTRRICTARLSDVASRPVEWLWPGRIPIGKLTLLAGDPGLGKSFVTLNIASHVSRGTVWPDGAGAPAPGTVILFSAEDDPADTIRPRLEAMHADLAGIVVAKGVEWPDGKRREFNLVDDLPQLQELLSQNPDTRLVVVDPISAFCGRTETHVNAEVRSMLSPLARLAAEHGVAVIAVTHLSKGVGGKAVYRASGSLAFAAAARGVWHVGKAPDDPTRRLLLPVKMNLSPDPTGMAYRIVEGRVEWEPEPITMHADDLLATESGGRLEDPTERDQAAGWLRELLANGPVESRQVLKQGSECGFSESTIRRAKGNLRVAVKREGFGAEGKWLWALPDSIDAHPGHRCSPPHVSTYDENEQLWDDGSIEEGVV